MKEKIKDQLLIPDKDLQVEIALKEQGEGKTALFHEMHTIEEKGNFVELE